MSSKNLDWLEKFKQEKGRPLRVLHVGNIANNAYLNAKLLRQVGVDADVLCYDYYHVMGCAEWEELEVKHDYKNDFFPKFDKKDLKGYKTPAWFIQGPLPLCYLYILAKFKGRIFLKSLIRIQMIMARKSMNAHKQGTLIGYFFIGGNARSRLKHIFLSRVMKFFQLVLSFKKKLVNTLNTRIINFFPRKLREYLARVKAKIDFLWGNLVGYLKNAFYKKTSENLELDDIFFSLRQEFENYFPSRENKLKYEDFFHYRGVIKLWSNIFAHYDIVQCYGTDPIVGMLANPPIYIAYEHGTLRDFTMGDSGLHRMNALGYRKADHVFITNGDCLLFAEKLGITKYSAMVHPIIVVEAKDQLVDFSKKIRAKYKADVLLFCPIRHDWATKGTDMHIRALPEILKRLKCDVKLVLVNWGAEVGKSCDLIAELACTNNVEWLSPLSRKRLIQYMFASDIVLDQMALPHFGATAPQAISVGTPVVMSYRPESTAWIVGEPAPILPAFTAEDVVESVVQGLDPVWREDYKKRAFSWIRDYHHSDRIVAEHLSVYERLVGEKNACR